jgi:DNA modification methylase
MEYGAFLQRKLPEPEAVGLEPAEVPDLFFDFQRSIAGWAIRRGRAAVFSDCGTGKTLVQVEWARQSGANVLIVAPLAVAEQTIAEARDKLGVTVTFASDPQDQPGIWITNYQKLHRFVGAKYDAIVLDESSILKSVDGATRGLLLSEFATIPRRLCCTATPAPNDISELANHAEFLGVMKRAEMLATFFVHDSDTSAHGGWRIKGHAREAFWRWVATWAVYVRRPSDLGFDDGPFVLPPLDVHDERVSTDFRPDGELFPRLVAGVSGRALARKSTLSARVERAAAVIKASDEQWVVWCGLNDEGRELARALGDECALIEGSDTDDNKIAREQLWRSGGVRVLITKSAMFGMGLNWQHCRNVLYLGLGDSFESYYQSVRRCWRFGQERAVNVVIVTSDAEAAVVENVRRKERSADEMAEQVTGMIREAQIENVRAGESADRVPYVLDDEHGDGWRMMLGDCVERLREVPTHSVGLTVFSPPFASLYTYSASDRDMGNSRDYDQFFEHFDYLIPELLRVSMPGRRTCVHVQQVTTTKATHGQIGWRDFRADVVRHFIDAGFVYDGEVVIDKDPQAQAIRTKSKALMFVQKNKDSAWSRPAMADYILLFRAPGDNIEPVKTDVSNEEWIQWARPIWYGIRESETLNAAEARDAKDERHICPLQLGTIERCVRLWSNAGDTVLSPFAGIGSEGYVAIQHGRKFIGVELKPGYWRAAVKNLRSAQHQGSLFADAVPA